MDSYRIRSSLAILGILLSVVWVVPNFVNVDQISWWPSKNKINYGLDIQGGLHLVMGVDVEGVIHEGIVREAAAIRALATQKNIPIKDITPSASAQGEMTIETDGAAARAQVESLISENYASVFQVIGTTDTSLTIRYFDAYLMDLKDRTLQQSIETIRNRIDEFGVSEPSISRQGDSRILIQLPGMADAERAKELINTTAKLDFMIVSLEMDPAKLQALVAETEKAGGYSMATLKYSDYVTRLNKDLEGKIPPKTVVYFEKTGAKMEEGAVPYLLTTDTGLGGKELDNAFISYGQFGEPEVGLRFNSAGATRFADLTGSNVNRQMAVVLDRIVKSAPNIKDRIAGGSAVITLGGRDREGMMNEAKMISTALRAGALPASLEQLEERRVGPTLGADSIASAKLGSFIGIGLVVLFMLLYYKGMGAIATVSLGINALCIFALLTAFGATLTLPGIAGIALTVGVAVDANVLINERIKDELRMGSTFKNAIPEGYRRAMSAILDSNITTAATAVILLYFGTGPVRGFAVTLLLGIIATLFANVFVSKIIVETLVDKFGIKKIPV